MNSEHAPSTDICAGIPASAVVRVSFAFATLSSALSLSLLLPTGCRA
ncbi:hypothetical protein ACFOEY_01600 [Paracandidimonas soli]